MGRSTKVRSVIITVMSRPNNQECNQEGPHDIRYLLDLYYAVQKALAPNTETKQESKSEKSD